MPTPRPLTFNNWNTIEADLQQLLQGYEKQGNWNLAQTALHLNDWITFPMDGFPPQPWPLRPIMAIFRFTLGQQQLKRTLKQGFGNRKPTLSSTVHAESESQDVAAVEALLKSVHRFQQFPGPLHPSPLFGQMDRVTVEQLQFVHFAHHLKWLVPASHQSEV